MVRANFNKRGAFHGLDDLLDGLGKFPHLIEGHDILQMYEALLVLGGFLLKVLVFKVVGVAKVEFDLPADSLNDIVVLENEKICGTLFLIDFSGFNRLLVD